LIFNGIAGLWESDGTAAGTVLMKTINPKAAAFADYFTKVGATTFFTANDGTAGNELWKSDGTAAGTVLVKDINPGANWSEPINLINVNGTLYFRAFSVGNGRELWKSDGTVAGTVMVKDINPGVGSSNGPVDLFYGYAGVLNSQLIFRATNGVNGYELWKSDGTAAGTVMIKDIVPGAGNSNPHSFVTIGTTTFFTANNQLWKTNGTAVGTVMLMAGPVPGSSNSEVRMMDVNGTLFFAANNQLWKSDGTVAGTVMVENVANPRHFVNLNNVLLFVGGDGVSPGLWRSNGTAAGTYRIRSNILIPGYASQITGIGTIVNGDFWFRAEEGLNGVEIWKTSGSLFGTSMLQEIMPGIGSSNAMGFVKAVNKVFISVNSADYGIELWAANVPFKFIPFFTMPKLEGHLRESNGVLGWNVEQPELIASIELERSVDGIHFSKLNEPEERRISFRQNHLDSNITSLHSTGIYYRLLVSQKNGEKGYSNVVLLNISSTNSKASIFPNPARQQATIQIDSKVSENVNIRIVDVNGRLLEQRNVIVAIGQNNISLDINRYASGVYYVSIISQTRKQTLQLNKQ
jgi:ELWxxDGT repeat protein